MKPYLGVFLGAIIVVSLIVAVIYVNSYLNRQVYPKFTIESTIPGINASLVDETSLDKYIKAWGIGNAFEIATYPSDGNAVFQTVNNVTVRLVPDIQQFGHRSLKPGSAPVTSYNLNITNNSATLVIQLDKSYWSGLDPVQVSKDFSAFVLTDLYEVSHYPPRQDWQTIDQQGVLVTQTVDKQMPIFILDINHS
jgi:hypothetical protein